MSRINQWEGKIIPPDHASNERNLIICFDGTGDEFDADNSNVVQFFEVLRKDDYTKQLVYYQSGIGTYTSPQFTTPIMTKISKILDLAIAWNLDAHVMDGYEFLVQNYKTGDRICIFGFSRGGYTARGLAAMIYKVGILPRGNRQQIPFAYKLYKRSDEFGWRQAVAFKRTFSVPVKYIEFVGVWDTVASVASNIPFTSSNVAIRTFRHALSLDERRAKFKSNMWTRPSVMESKLGTADDTKQPVVTGNVQDTSPFEDHAQGDAQSGTFNDHLPQPLCLRQVGKGSEPIMPTDVQEVWFAGCHCDVGGGSVSNDESNALARIPLRWMIRECLKTNSGIMFDAAKLCRLGLDPASLYPNVLPRPGPLPAIGRKIRSIGDQPRSYNQKEWSEEVEELEDALSPVYDQLSIKKWWWILEYWPIRQRYQKANGIWVSELSINRGGPRKIQQGYVNMHRSVKTRIEAEYEHGKGRYTPRALTPGNDRILYVD